MVLPGLSYQLGPEKGQLTPDHLLSFRDLKNCVFLPQSPANDIISIFKNNLHSNEDGLPLKTIVPLEMSL